MSLWWGRETDVTVSGPPQHWVLLQDLIRQGCRHLLALMIHLKQEAPPSHHDCSKERRLGWVRGTGVSWDWLLKKRCLASHRSSPWLTRYTSSYFSSTVTRYIQVRCSVIRLAWLELFSSFDIVTLLPVWSSSVVHDLRDRKSSLKTKMLF